MTDDARPGPILDVDEGALDGRAYRAVYRLANGDDDVTYAAIGETCARVPVASLAGLLTHGYIVPIATAPPAADPHEDR